MDAATTLANREYLNYKIKAFTLILLISYTVIHIKLTGVYIDATIDKWFNFTVRLPFGQRLLTPLMARGIAYILPLDIASLFVLIEFFFSCLLYWALNKLLLHAFSSRQSQALSWLFFLLLPLITVINYRDAEATFYYPYDTASLFFIVGGFALCLEKRWRYFIPWIALATLNRESSILLVLLIPAIHHQTLKEVIKPFFCALAVYILVRSAILHQVASLPGPLMEWFFRRTTHTYFEANLAWLFGDENLFVFLFCFAAIPLLWFTFYDYIPVRYRPLRYLGIIYFFGLLLVGNFMEARIFAEIVALIYLPVCVALKHWMAGESVLTSTTAGQGMSSWLYYANRYAILAFFAVIILFRETWQTLLGVWLSS
ncbi:MAG: hypothetical protein H2069_00330 [Legionella sp.]|nr:hypothetical protein [Legionella sp.]